MCKGNCGHIMCDAPGSRAPLAGCVPEGPTLHTLPHGKSDEGDEVQEACLDVVSAVNDLKDSIAGSGGTGDDADKSLVPLYYLYLMSTIADVTNALVTYLEPEDGGEPYFLYD